MRRLLVPTTVVLVLGLLAGGAAYATGGTEATRDDGSSTLRFLDVGDKFEFADVGEAGESPGDMAIFENKLRNRADTRTLGRFLGACTFLVSSGLASCRGTLELADGTIEVATAVDFGAGGPILAAVTGGTKRYRDVDGQMRLSEEISPGVRRMTVVLDR